jgi:hypothetical protein
MSTSTDYAYRAAEKARNRAMDRDNLRHALSEGIAYAVVVVASAVTFALAVMEVGK